MQLNTLKSVERLYNTYPFPPDPLSDQPPPGYNWRWHWQAAYNFCLGRLPQTNAIRILDAGCGTGSGTDYLIYLNPEAEVVAIDLSQEALKIAQERCEKSGAIKHNQNKVTFQKLELEKAAELPGQFELINCVGVLHHLREPQQGIKALAEKLAPGGLLHIFVYAELGRWEIQLMQQAIALLQGENRGDYRQGVKIGRQLFANLPPHNRLVKREQERWAGENQRDAAFADMYVHPQEIDYNIYSLFDLIEASGLEFLGFSNPQYWQLERLIGSSPELLEQAAQLSERDLYRLIELLDPDISHYEFFLGKPPLLKSDWSQEEDFLAATALRQPCLDGWPSTTLFDYQYQLVQLSEAEYQLLTLCDGQKTMTELLKATGLKVEQGRSLQERQLILLHPNSQK